MRRTILFLAVALIAVPSLSGCGGGKATVRGKVSYQGRPILVGSVMMVGPDGATRLGNIEPDGSYTVEGITAGTVQIGVVSRKPVATVRAAEPESQRPQRTLSGSSPRAAAVPPPEASKWFEIPAKYEEPTTSGVSREIKSGENPDVNIDLP